MRKEHFCCVSCGRLLACEQAYVIFRTGFYRVVHPLGYCGECASLGTDGQLAELISILPPTLGDSVANRDVSTNEAIRRGLVASEFHPLTTILTGA